MRAAPLVGTLGAFIALGGWEHDALLELLSERSTLQTLVLDPLREITARAECAADEASVIAVAFAVLTSVMRHGQHTDGARAARVFVSAGGREVLIQVLLRHRTSRAVVASAASIVHSLRQACADAAGTGTPFEAWSGSSFTSLGALAPGAHAPRATLATDDALGTITHSPSPGETPAVSQRSVVQDAAASRDDLVPAPGPLAALPPIVSVATALYSCAAETAGDLDFSKGDTLIVTRIDSEHWWCVENPDYRDSEAFSQFDSLPVTQHI